MDYSALIDDLMFESEETAQKILDEKYPGLIVYINDDNIAYVFNQKGQPVVKIAPSGSITTYDNQ